MLILGSNFAGLAAATELARALGGSHPVTVIARTDQFLKVPLLPRYAFGLVRREDLGGSLRPRLEELGVELRQEEIERIDLRQRRVFTRDGVAVYDRLLIATGIQPNFGAVPGMGPRGYSQSIVSLAEAERARAAFERFLFRPGPVVCGCVRGAWRPSVAIEFLRLCASALQQRALSARAPLTLVVPPGLTHPDEELLGGTGVRVVRGNVLAVTPAEVQLVDGPRLPFSYSMLVPPCLGADPVRACDELTNAAGFVRVNDGGQSLARPEVFAAGAAVATPLTELTTALCEESGRLAGRSLAASVVR